MDKTATKFNIKQFETDKITIEATTEILESRKESLFYYGQVAELKHEDYPGHILSVEARGEVRIHDDEELIREGELPFESKDPNKRLMTDEDLERNIKELNFENPSGPNYSMGNNNWFEVFVIKEGEETVESTYSVHYTIDEVLSDVVENFEEFKDAARFI